MNSLEKELKALIDQYDAMAESVTSERERIADILCQKHSKLGKIQSWLGKASIYAVVGIIISVAMHVFCIISEAASTPALLNIFDITVVIAVSVVIVLNITERRMKKEIDDEEDKAPQNDWISWYKAMKSILIEMNPEIYGGTEDSKKSPVVVINDKPQYFIPSFRLMAGYKTGMYGETILSSKTETEFMTSIYGNEFPEGSKTKTIQIPINNPAKLRAWETLPQIDAIELPYMSITMFANMPYYCDKTYLIPRTENVDDVREAFDTICRMVLYDVIRKKLKDGIKEGVDPIKGPSVNGERITSWDLYPYFKKGNRHKGPEDLQDEFTYLENIMTPLLAQQNDQVADLPRILNIPESSQ